jgi:lipopolysaccharide transport system ATP-binding protein
VLARGKVALFGPSDEVVAGYLGLSTSDAAKFRVDGIPLEIHRASMEDWETSFQIEVKCEGRVDFGFSIELLRLGIGWEILVLSKMQQIADQPGKYQVSVRIPTLPLAPGAYSLNIFLGHHQHDGTYSSAPVRSWTTGNAIPFIVSGDHGAAVATPKLDWRINRGQDASN